MLARHSLFYVLVLIIMLISVLGLLYSSHAGAANNTSRDQTKNQTKNQTKEDSKESIKNYGVYGHLFEIEEVSLLEEIMEKLAQAQKSGKIEKLQAEFIEKVKAKVLRPLAVENITKAKLNRSWTYDPTYRQDTDIVDDRGRVIVAAGTSVNALERMNWGEPILFIDGDDAKQVAWVRNRAGKITLTNGAPMKLSEELKRPVYFDQGGTYCRRFKIESVPSIIEQEGTLLRISEVKI